MEGGTRESKRRRGNEKDGGEGWREGQKQRMVGGKKNGKRTDGKGGFR